MTKIKWIIVLGVFIAFIFTQQSFAQSGDLELDEIIEQAQNKVQEVDLLIQNQNLDKEENTRALEKSASSASVQESLESLAIAWPGCDLSNCDYSECDFPKENAKYEADKEKVDEIF